MGAIGVVLAGGRSSRMGMPKAGLQLAGRPLLDFPATAMRDAGLEVVVVAKASSDLPRDDVPVWQEPERPHHPLLGIVTALERSGAGAVAVCACDMPFVSAELLRHLAGLEQQLAVSSAGGRLHPLCARYEASLLPDLRTALDEQLSLHETVGRLDPLLLDEQDLARFGNPERLLFNVNTPEDLARAQELLDAG